MAKKIDQREPKTDITSFTELKQILAGNDAVFEIKEWTIRDDAETRILGIANQQRARITLKPKHDLCKLTGLDIDTLASLGNVGTGAFSWEERQWPYYDFILPKPAPNQTVS